MILPSGKLSQFNNLIRDSECVLIGALSFEERCCSLPLTISVRTKKILFKIQDPITGFPNYSDCIEEKIKNNRERLSAAKTSFEEIPTDLLASEDTLLDMIQQVKREPSNLYILDITSLPKRFFCFFLRYLVKRDWCQNLLVTYTMAGPEGYSPEHLTASPMTRAPLPGFSSSAPLSGDTLVISLGFESLNIRSIIDVYTKKRLPKILMSFPCSTLIIKRQWNMLRHIFSKGQIRLSKKDIKSVATWDAEEVYRTLQYWQKECGHLAIAPFGTKPHSLGLALYAIKSDSAMYYTQPTSYNPDYSRGVGETWGYLVKHRGICCYDRQRERI